MFLIYTVMCNFKFVFFCNASAARRVVHSSRKKTLVQFLIHHLSSSHLAMFIMNRDSFQDKDVKF